MKVSPEVQIACSVAATEAQRRGHDIVGVEHLLYALLMDEETCRVLEKSGSDTSKLKQELDVRPNRLTIDRASRAKFHKAL